MSPMAGLRRISRGVARFFPLGGSRKVLLFSPIIGLVAGLGAVGFYTGLNLVIRLCLWIMMDYIPPGPGGEPLPPGVTAHLPVRWWLVPIIPALGGLLSALTIYLFAREAGGDGTDAAIRSFHHLGGKIRGRVPFVKGIASILTIGTGGSAGREGPTSQIGAGFGSMMANLFHFSTHERRLATLAGMGAGLGAIFRAPLGGAFFAIEVLYSTAASEAEAFVPTIVASITAYSVLTVFQGGSPIFTIPSADLRFRVPALPFYLAFAVLCAVAGWLYVFTLHTVRDRIFRPLPIPGALKPALGGLGTGLLALGLPQIMAGGYGWMQNAIDGQMTHHPFEMFLMLFLAKMLATCLTVGSGGSGGLFAPSLFIGAMLGGAYGTLASRWFPGEVPHPATFALLGMAGFFAGVAKTPLAALFLVIEMSQSYNLLIPLILICAVSYLLSSRWGLYEEQVPSQADSPAHLGDFVVDVLERIPVAEVYNPGRAVDYIPQDMPLPQILQIIAESPNHNFPVIDDQRHMIGILSISDVRAVLAGNGAGSLIVAADLASEPVLTVTPQDNLHQALRQFTRKNLEELPVVDPADPDRVIGVLDRRAVVGAYDQRLASLRAAGG